VPHDRASLGRRLGRTLRLGAATARVSTGWAAATLLGGAGGRSAARSLLRSSSARVAATLGQMKGLAMKVGQYLSFALPDLPPELAEALASLQTRSAPRPFEPIAEMVEAELGRPLADAFESFEPEPVAAASIGQVHRATLPGGAPVAVKVQYPDVALQVRADLASVPLLVRLLRLVVPGVEAEAVAAEIRARILEELDYRSEARWQEAFAARWAGHPFFAIPRVVPSHSTGRVLTTAWAEGRDFAAALQDPEPVRSAHGEILFRFLLGNLLGAGEILADPHPGNYRFDERGERSTFLDFGCVKELPPQVRAGMRQLFRAALDADGEGQRRAAERLGVLGGAGRSRAVVEALVQLYLPFRRDARGPFPAPLSAAALRAASGPGMGRVRKALRVPGDLPFVNRTVVGLYAVLARLGAVAGWHGIAREYAFGDPPATPLGVRERRWRAARPPAPPTGRQA